MKNQETQKEKKPGLPIMLDKSDPEPIKYVGDEREIVVVTITGPVSQMLREFFPLLYDTEAASERH